MTEEREHLAVSVDRWIKTIENEELRSEICWDRRALARGSRMHEKMHLPGEFNCIPGEPGRDCFQLLIVFAGYNDDLELHLEKAVNHVAVLCPKTASLVIIYAAKWNSATWLEIRQKFERIRQQSAGNRLTIVLKIVGLRPQVLMR